jgi:multiple sugar transport system substrate-binding protein
MTSSKTSRRDFLKAAAAASAGAVLAACGAGEVKEVIVTSEVIKEVEVTKEVETVVKETVVVEQAAPSEPITLNFFNRGGEYIFQVMDEQMKAYQATGANVEFEINSVSSWSHQEALLLMLAAGTGPDCWFDSVRTTGIMAKKGVATQIDDFLAARADFKKEDYVPSTFVCQTFDGKVFGIPWDSGAMLLFFNKALLDSAGVAYPDPTGWLTWDEAIALGKQLTFDLDNNTPLDAAFDPGRVKQYGFVPDTFHGRQTYMWGNLAEIIAADMTMPIDTPEFTEAMNKLADAGLVEYVAPSAKYQTAFEVDLRAQNVALMHTGIWDMGSFVDAGVDFGMVQVPYMNKQSSYGQYSPLCVYKESKYVPEAFDFIYFCCATYDGQKILVDKGVLQPTRNDLRDEFLQNPNPPAPEYRKVAFEVLENADTFRWPGDTINSYWGGSYQYFIDLWEPYLTDLFAGNKRWEEIAPELRPKTEELLKTGEPA